MEQNAFQILCLAHVLCGKPGPLFRDMREQKGWRREPAVNNNPELAAINLTFDHFVCG